MQTFLDDGNQYVGAHRNPDLRFHRVFARAQEGLDAQVLFVGRCLPGRNPVPFLLPQSDLLPPTEN